jgi:adenosine kinase
MQFAHENNVADAGRCGWRSSRRTAATACSSTPRDCAALKVPFMFDPGQQLPMFSGERTDRLHQQGHLRGRQRLRIRDADGPHRPDLAEIAGRLDALIVTRGEKGSEIYAGGQRFEIPCVPAAAVVDPTGCGDAFRAGLLYGITNGFDWPTTGRLASLMGAIKIATRAARTMCLPRPARRQVRSRVRLPLLISRWGQFPDRPTGAGWKRAKPVIVLDDAVCPFY